MGLRGPAPKPTQLKILEGNPGKQKIRNTAASGNPETPGAAAARGEERVETAGAYAAGAGSSHRGRPLGLRRALPELRLLPRDR